MTAQEYYNRGLEAEKKKDYDQAVENFKAVLEVVPDNPNVKTKLFLAYCNRGDEYRDKMELDRAIADCTDAISLGLDGMLAAGAYSLRGAAYNMKGERKKAIDDWKKGLEYQPDGVFADQLKENIASTSKKLDDLNALEQRAATSDAGETP